jgi:hypothetical protein
LDEKERLKPKAANIIDQCKMEPPAVPTTSEESALQVPASLQNTFVVTESSLVSLVMPDIPLEPTLMVKMPEQEETGEPQVTEPEKVEVAALDAKEKRKNLTDQQRVAIVHYLLANSAGGRLKHGDMKAAATHFGVHRATIRRLWKLHSSSEPTDGLAGNVASRIKGHSGRKPKVPDEELKIRIAAIPVERRMTGRGLSTALGVSNSVVVRLIKSGKLRRHPKKLHYIM